jgi:Fic family protein
MAKDVISTPALYISYFLKRNRIEYYDRLMYVREEGNYEQWITFFLSAIRESAEDAIAAIDKLTALHTTNTSLIAGMGRSSKNLKRVFSYLEENPIIEIQKTAEALGLAFNTVASAINRLLEAEILVQTENVRRNRTFSYKAYLDILRDGT